MKVLLKRGLWLSMRGEGSRAVLQLMQWREEKFLDRGPSTSRRVTVMAHGSGSLACFVDLEKGCQASLSNEIEKV